MCTGIELDEADQDKAHQGCEFHQGRAITVVSAGQLLLCIILWYLRICACCDYPDPVASACGCRKSCRFVQLCVVSCTKVRFHSEFLTSLISPSHGLKVLCWHVAIAFDWQHTTSILTVLDSSTTSISCLATYCAWSPFCRPVRSWAALFIKCAQPSKLFWLVLVVLTDSRRGESLQPCAMLLVPSVALVLVVFIHHVCSLKLSKFVWVIYSLNTVFCSSVVTRLDLICMVSRLRKLEIGSHSKFESTGDVEQTMLNGQRMIPAAWQKARPKVRDSPTYNPL